MEKGADPNSPALFMVEPAGGAGAEGAGPGAGNALRLPGAEKAARPPARKLFSDYPGPVPPGKRREKIRSFQPVGADAKGSGL